MGTGASKAAAAPKTVVSPGSDPPVVMVQLDDDDDDPPMVMVQLDESSNELDEASESGKLVLLLGADGSFSPADGASLAATFKGTYIQYQQVMREAILAGSPAGAEIARALTSGGAVPARLILEFLAPKVASTPSPHLLDGFSRSRDHLTLLESEVQPCTWAIHFAPTDNEIINNLIRRGVEPTVAEKRLDLHYSQTMPVVRLLNLRGVLTTVTGPDALQEAETALRAALGGRRQQAGAIMTRGLTAKESLLENMRASPNPPSLSMDGRPPPPVPLTPLFGSPSYPNFGGSQPSFKKQSSTGSRKMPGPPGQKQVYGPPPPPPPPSLPALPPAPPPPPPVSPAQLAAATSLQACVRSSLVRKHLHDEKRAAVKWQAVMRGGIARRRIERARPPRLAGPDKIIVIRATYVNDADTDKEDAHAAPPYEADLYGITRVAKNELGLFQQPCEPSFRVGMVQIYLRKMPFGGPDKSSNGHRFDMVALANGIILAGMSCHPFHYIHEEHDSFLDVCRGFDALLLRFGTADIEADGGKRAKFLGGMKQLQHEAGIVVWPWPAEGGGLPAQMIAAFDEPGVPRQPRRMGTGIGNGATNPVAEAAWLGPAFSQCEEAICTAKQPKACWIDVGENNMTSAIACASRVAQAMRKLLEEARDRKKKNGG